MFALNYDFMSAFSRTTAFFALLGTLKENDSKLRNMALPGAQAIEKVTWAGDVAQQAKMLATKADDKLGSPEPTW